VRLHLTNVVGTGAVQLLESLLPALEHDPNIVVDRIDLPDHGNLATYRSYNPSTVTKVYSRFLPNALSRFLECTWFAKRFNGHTPLLVLGDLPLRCRGPQTVLIHQSNLLKPERFDWRPSQWKYVLSRAVFSWNLHRVSAFIVQTEVMREAVERSYHGVIGKIHVIAQPVPSWLQDSGLRRYRREQRKANQSLNLIYPAANYPHKNHALLSLLNSQDIDSIERLTLTIDAKYNPAKHLSWIQCVGFLSPKEMIKAYSHVDALLFLSQKESYGFPLVEAMFVGIPIVCPDLPYAHALCGEEAIYFAPDKPESLHQALNLLHLRLNKGWWPDWSNQLSKLPKNWEEVAHSMLKIACQA